MGGQDIAGNIKFVSKSKKFSLSLDGQDFESLPFLESSYSSGEDLSYAGRVTVNGIAFASNGKESWKPHILQHQIFSNVGEKPITSIKIEGVKASASVMSQLLQVMAGLNIAASGLEELSLDGFSGASGPIDKASIEALFDKSQ